ncbi:MAG: molybdate ABC transporter substrate-binding protein [Clostridiaceae bacterium]
MNKKVPLYLILIAAIISLFTGCNLKVAKAREKSTTLLVAAAASMETVLEEAVIPIFEEKYSDIDVLGSYDASGKLALQIQEGIPADIFLSASMSHMEDLQKKELIKKENTVNLLENKLVLIVPKASKGSYKTFQDIRNAKTIAIGDPLSVPAGEYGREVLEAMGLWEEIYERASLGTNVTEVLRWVAEGSAEAGLVYSTDAALEKDKVVVIEEAPKEFFKKKILYPAGIIEDCENLEAAKEFLAFLSSGKVKDIFISYGFSPLK